MSLRVEVRHEPSRALGGGDEYLIEIWGDIRADTFLGRIDRDHPELRAALGDPDNLFLLINAIRIMQKHRPRIRWYVEMNTHVNSVHPFDGSAQHQIESMNVELR